MISKLSAQLESWVLWFRLQSPRFRIGFSFVLAIASTASHGEMSFFALVCISVAVAAGVDTWWERYFSSTVDERIRKEVEILSANFHEQVEARAAQMVAQGDIDAQEEAEDGYEYEFPQKHERTFPDPTTGSGAVAVGEHGWKITTRKGEENGEDDGPESGGGEDGS